MLALGLAGCGGLVSAASAQAPAKVVISGTVRLPSDARMPAILYLETADPAPLDTVFIDQRHLTYVPGLTVVTPGTPVTFRNSDPVVHNVFSPTASTVPFDLGRYGSDEMRTHVFTQPGLALILCRVHPEMVARVMVVSASVWTLTEADGSFHIEVPTDSRELVVWYPRQPERRVPLSGTAVRSMVIDLR
jgi:plastocyanin